MSSPPSNPQGKSSPKSSPKGSPKTSPKGKATASPPGSSPPGPASPGLLPPQHWANLQEELGPEDDGDSAFGDGASSTDSVTSSILHYRTIHGRKYHSESINTEYWMPLDETQQEAMDINHHVLTLLIDDKLYLAPLKKDIQKVLDIGTGTGIWAIDFADSHPDAQVIGTDIAPIQPTWVPPNLQFEIDDCTAPWTFPPETFDYIHCRWLIGSITDWYELFRQAYKATKPGGWVESYEPSSFFTSDDGTVVEGSALDQWGRFFVEGSKKIGRSFEIVQEDTQRRAMEEAGFVDIQVRDVKNPVGRWPRDKRQAEIGSFMQLAFEQDASGTVMFMALLLGWQKEEVDVFLAQFRREIRDMGIHGYYYQRVVWGRKPEAAAAGNR